MMIWEFLFKQTCAEPFSQLIVISYLQPTFYKSKQHKQMCSKGLMCDFPNFLFNLSSKQLVNKAIFPIKKM